MKGMCCAVIACLYVGVLAGAFEIGRRGHSVDDIQNRNYIKRSQLPSLRRPTLQSRYYGGYSQYPEPPASPQYRVTLKDRLTTKAISQNVQIPESPTVSSEHEKNKEGLTGVFEVVKEEFKYDLSEPKDVKEVRKEFAQSGKQDIKDTKPMWDLGSIKEVAKESLSKIIGKESSTGYKLPPLIDSEDTKEDFPAHMKKDFDDKEKLTHVKGHLEYEVNKENLNFQLPAPPIPYFKGDATDESLTTKATISTLKDILVDPIPVPVPATKEMEKNFEIKTDLSLKNIHYAKEKELFDDHILEMPHLSRNGHKDTFTSRVKVPTKEIDEPAKISHDFSPIPEKDNSEEPLNKYKKNVDITDTIRDLKRLELFNEPSARDPVKEFVLKGYSREEKSETDKKSHEELMESKSDGELKHSGEHHSKAGLEEDLKLELGEHHPEKSFDHIELGHHIVLKSKDELKDDFKLDNDGEHLPKDELAEDFQLKRFDAHYPKDDLKEDLKFNHDDAHAFKDDLKDIFQLEHHGVQLSKDEVKEDFELGFRGAHLSGDKPKDDLKSFHHESSHSNDEYKEVLSSAAHHLPEDKLKEDLKLEHTIDGLSEDKLKENFKSDHIVEYKPKDETEDEFKIEHQKFHVARKEEDKVDLKSEHISAQLSKDEIKDDFKLDHVAKYIPKDEAKEDLKLNHDPHALEGDLKESFKLGIHLSKDTPKDEVKEDIELGYRGAHLTKDEPKDDFNLLRLKVHRPNDEIKDFKLEHISADADHRLPENKLEDNFKLEHILVHLSEDKLKDKLESDHGAIYKSKDEAEDELKEENHGFHDLKGDLKGDLKLDHGAGYIPKDEAKADLKLDIHAFKDDLKDSFQLKRLELHLSDDKNKKDFELGYSGAHISEDEPKDDFKLSLDEAHYPNNKYEEKFNSSADHLPGEKLWDNFKSEHNVDHFSEDELKDSFKSEHKVDHFSQDELKDYFKSEHHVDHFSEDELKDNLKSDHIVGYKPKDETEDELKVEHHEFPGVKEGDNTDFKFEHQSVHPPQNETKIDLKLDHGAVIAVYMPKEETKEDFKLKDSLAVILKDEYANIFKPEHPTPLFTKEDPEKDFEDSMGKIVDHDHRKEEADQKHEYPIKHSIDEILPHDKKSDLIDAVDDADLHLDDMHHKVAKKETTDIQKDLLKEDKELNEEGKYMKTSHNLDGLEDGFKRLAVASKTKDDVLTEVVKHDLDKKTQDSSYEPQSISKDKDGANDGIQTGPGSKTSKTNTMRRHGGRNIGMGWGSRSDLESE